MDIGKKKGKLLLLWVDVFFFWLEMNVLCRFMVWIVKIISLFFERGVKDKDVYVLCGLGEVCLEFLNGIEGFLLFVWWIDCVVVGVSDLFEFWMFVFVLLWFLVFWRMYWRMVLVVELDYGDVGSGSVF